MIKSEKVNAQVSEWQEDSLPNAADNKKVERQVTNAARTATTLRTNNTQILSDTFEVSATADAVAALAEPKRPHINFLRL